MQIAREHKDQLARIKENIRKTYDYFKPNYDRFNQSMKFVFDTSITDDDRAVLSALNNPQIEFNILEAFVSRQYAEFAKHEPSISIATDDGVPIVEQTLNTLEDHVRHILFESGKDGTQYHTYRDSMGGGFSALKVMTEYANANTFNQVIKLKKVFNPVMCGFDVFANDPHKGDADYCFEIYPRTKKEFQEEFPKIDISKISFTRGMQGFEWSYTNDKEDILILCDYYEKRKKRKKLVEIARPNKQTMLKEDYDKMVEEWVNNEMIEPVPPIVNERYTTITEVVRYICIESEILSYTVTDYEDLPMVFVDGNSVMIKQGTGNAYSQMTRPFVYHAFGAQKLKNFSGQTLANELENLIQHKFIVKVEALPEEKPFLDAYTNIQSASVMMVKAFKDNNADQPIPEPIREVVRVPIPPEVTNTFTLIDQTTQSILGSYDAALGINDNQLSGKAIALGATQSNSAATPYLVSYLQSLTRVANIIVNLIPKYYKTARTIPVVRKDGKREYVRINDKNDPNSIDFNFDSNALQVKVEAGVNFQIAQHMALNQIISMSQGMPIFQQFINEEGLDIVMDNFDIRGADVLKERAEEWMKKMKQMRAQQEQMAQEQHQNNPKLLEIQNERIKLAQEEKYMNLEAKFKESEIEIKQMEGLIEKLKVMAGIRNEELKTHATLAKAQAEEARASADLHMKNKQMVHDHSMDVLEHHHKVKSHEERVKNDHQKTLD